ncbi:MAG: class I SAM-dependent methyltransferase [Bryobacteraceae bacterium]|nr:class I SAM-dependent methyltransferase [Bryobacteraceae bacterium]
MKDLDPSRARILAVGERGGGVSLWFALRGYQVVCSDLGGPADSARRLHCAYGVSDRVQYESIDVFAISHRSEEFDIVVSKSVIGGLKLVYKDPSTRTLENQSRAMREIHRVLKPNGVWLGAENMQGSLIHRRLRTMSKAKVGWRHLAPSDWPELLAPFSHREIQYFGYIPTLFRTPALNWLAHSANRTLDPVLPRNHKYIAFVTATK